MMTIKELAELVRDVKRQISDEYRAFDGDDMPGIQLTVACNDDGSAWNFQTGDNSYTGGAYGFPHWAVVGVYRDSNSRELARDIIDQLRELMPRREKIRIYDNGGKTFDRYTCVYMEREHSAKHGTFEARGMSANPFHPQGFGQYCSAQPGRHLGKRIAFDDLPEDCRRLVTDDMR